MNVLSLFDGMSCGQIALKELGISVEHYFASEVDKFAIEQTQLNFPNTIQLGDVSQVHAKDLPKIDLLIGGSPCQGFSFAGQQLAFDDPRSKLFFEFVRIWEEVKAINPDAKFLLENVRMKAEFEQVITEYMGIRPVMINSSLVSAQSRVRLYWSNIRVREDGLFRELVTDIPQPEDRGLTIKDIIESQVDEKYYISDTLLKGLAKHFNGKGQDIPTKGTNDKTWSICSTYQNCNNGTTLIRQLDSCDLVQFSRIRRLTPTECARLQAIPDWYRWGCSETQQYKMLGNGWTIEVIKHIFQYL